MIIYEQPVNELVRVCLRLEYLFAQLDLHMAKDPDFHTRDVIRLIVEILNVLDRPDLKSKFTQEFHRLSTVFAKLQDSPQISKDKLSSTLAELNELLASLINTRGKIAQPLRDNEFIANIRLHLMTPGGDCCFEVPGFHYWMQQSAETHVTLLKEWMADFQPIRSAMELLLGIVRTSAEPKEEMAENGFYHSTLNIQIPTQIIRVALDPQLLIYPESSVGKHRLTIRFMVPSITTRPKQTEEQLKFQLTICNI